MRFADMALLAEDERILENMLMELNDMWGLWDEDKYKYDEDFGYRKKTKEEKTCELKMNPSNKCTA